MFTQQPHIIALVTRVKLLSIKMILEASWAILVPVVSIENLILAVLSVGLSFVLLPITLIILPREQRVSTRTFLSLGKECTKRII